MVGTFTIDVVTADPYVNSTVSSFQVIVTADSPPAFDNLTLSDQVAFIGITIIYPLPTYSDSDSNASLIFTIGFGTASSFISQNSTSLIISPILASQIGTYSL